MPRRPAPAMTPSQQLTSFIARFDPAIQPKIRAARAALRRAYPTAIELVYDNYNALAIGFCSTPRASDCLVSVAAFAKGVSLSFYYGSLLSDPAGRLSGGGKQNRFIRVENSAVLQESAVLELLREAARKAKTPLPRTGRGKLIIQSVSARQRPRRPATGST